MWVLLGSLGYGWLFLGGVKSIKFNLNITLFVSHTLHMMTGSAKEQTDLDWLNQSIYGRKYHHR
jgi:hypothetical protein